MQPRGAGGARHFDNLVWELAIPEYDRREGAHRELAEAAAEAERVAGAVSLREVHISPASAGRSARR